MLVGWLVGPNISATIEGIAKSFCTDIHGPQIMTTVVIPCHFIEPLAGQSFYVSSEIS